MLATHQGIAKVLKGFVAVGIAGLAANSSEPMLGNRSPQERPLYLVLREEPSASEYFRNLERLRKNKPYD